MPDRITANLPARSLDRTAAFEDEGWMILRRGPLEIEFFPHPDLDPAVTATSACVRVADVDRLHAEWQSAGLPAQGIPRLTAPRDEPFGLRMFAMVDEDGNLLRCLSP